MDETKGAVKAGSVDGQTKEAVEQITRRKTHNNSPVIGDGGLMVSKDENAAFCKYALDIFHAPSVNLDDPEEVERAITGYFNSCIESGLRPGNLGLYAVLGLSKQDVSNALHGYSQKLGSETIDLIKKAKVALSTYREMLGSTGKINPVTLIFWQKNYDGLRDVQEVEIAPKTTLEPTQTLEQIEADIPIDVD